MEKIKELARADSYVNYYIRILRDKELQKDPVRFRDALSRLGFIMAYELSKSLNYKKVKTETPLSTTSLSVSSDKIVLAAILRAALPFHQGALELFQDAESAFISAYRKEGNGIEVVSEYSAVPDIEGKVLVLMDPMLATGKSAVACYDKLTERIEPKRTVFLSLFAAPEGLDCLTSHIPDCEIITACIDERLNSKAYIVPGLGDAGDLAYGVKLND